MISRSEGYRRAVGKEEAGLSVVESFLATRLGAASTRIEGAEDNYRRGDLAFRGDLTMEVKSQPIDPERYPMNFVEVAEETNNARHEGGFRDLASVLRMPPEKLENALVTDKRPGQGRRPFGRPRRLSVSLTPVLGSDMTIYVNSARGGEHLYAYRRDELLGHVYRAILRNGMVRGAGRSNEDTFAVFVPLADRIWSHEHGGWAYVGQGREPADLDALLEAP